MWSRNSSACLRPADAARSAPWNITPGELNVSPKYLSKVVKRTTGTNVFSFIDRYTVPILKDYLNDSRLSLTQIADAMNFSSLSYFSRYCTKHLGISPSEYRASLQPQGRQS